MAQEIFITIRARVISQQEKIFTCRLEDGLGNAEVVIHQEAVVESTAFAK